MGRKIALLGITWVLVGCPVASARVRLLESRHSVRNGTTALVGPSGSPVPVLWQRWTDQAKVPTYPGRVQMEISAAAAQQVCGFDPNGGVDTELILGCETLGVQTGLPEVILTPSGDERGVLYHELGHVFDSYVMTDRWRIRFMELWGVRPRRRITRAGMWGGVGTASQNGVPNEWFAEGYRLCAMYGRWTTAEALRDTPDARGYPAQDASGWRDTYRDHGHWVTETKIRPPRVRWAISTQNRVCSLIRAVSAG